MFTRKKINTTCNQPIDHIKHTLTIDTLNYLTLQFLRFFYMLKV